MSRDPREGFSVRVFLIYPPISKQERYSSAIGSAGGNQIPLGVFYLAAYLRQHGHDVQVIDAEARNLDAAAIESLVTDFAPDLIGISSTTVAFHRAVEVAEALKRRWPQIPIVLGGPHVSSNVAHAMSVPSFDYGVLGEGEATLLELCQAIEGGGGLGSVEGLVHRAGPEVIVNQPRTPRANLDELPFPAYESIPDLSLYTPPPCNYKKTPVANVITSRGCPNRCTFCDRSIFGQRLRQRSAENIAGEIELLVSRHGVREIAFVDDTFTIKPKRIRELFSILDRKGIAFPWTCMSRVDTVDEDLLKYMRDHGCWHVSFGIESGNESILREIDKNISLEQAERVIGWCAKLGIRSKGFFIVGHPGETEETIEETIRYALGLPLDDIVVTINTPIPGSYQHEHAAEFGILDETDWSQFNYWRPVFVPRGLSKELLVEKHREFYRRFYFRPHVLWRYFLSFLSLAGMRRFWTLLKALPFILLPASNSRERADSNTPTVAAQVLEPVRKP